MGIQRCSPEHSKPLKISFQSIIFWQPNLLFTRVIERHVTYCLHVFRFTCVLKRPGQTLSVHYFCFSIISPHTLQTPPTPQSQSIVHLIQNWLLPVHSSHTHSRHSLQHWLHNGTLQNSVNIETPSRPNIGLPLRLSRTMSMTSCRKTSRSPTSKLFKVISGCKAMNPEHSDALCFLM